MAHFDADKAKSLHEPISFTLGGERYNVVEFSQQVIDEIDRIVARQTNGEITVDQSLNEQLALITGSDPSIFESATLREKIGVISWVTKTIYDSSGAPAAKNARGK